MTTISIKSFFNNLLLMVINQKANKLDHWSNNPLLRSVIVDTNMTSFIDFCNLVTTRFKLILTKNCQ